MSDEKTHVVPLGGLTRVLTLNDLTGEQFLICCYLPGTSHQEGFIVSISSEEAENLAESYLTLVPELVADAKECGGIVKLAIIAGGNVTEVDRIVTLGGVPYMCRIIEVGEFNIN